MEILLPEAILSFPALGKPMANKFQPDQAPRFKCDLIFPKGTDLTEVNNAIQELIKEEFKGVQPKNLPVKPCSSRVDKQTGVIMPIYADGDQYMSPWSGENHPPVLLSPQAEEGYGAQHFKGGNRVRCSVRLWAGTGFGGTIGAQILVVQWLNGGKAPNSKPNINLFKPVEPTEPQGLPGFN